jgi:hypothetical protein
MHKNSLYLSQITSKKDKLLPYLVMLFTNKSYFPKYIFTYFHEIKYKLYLINSPSYFTTKKQILPPIFSITNNQWKLFLLLLVKFISSRTQKDYTKLLCFNFFIKCELIIFFLIFYDVRNMSFSIFYSLFFFVSFFFLFHFKRL